MYKYTPCWDPLGHQNTQLLKTEQSRATGEIYSFFLEYYKGDTFTLLNLPVFFSRGNYVLFNPQYKLYNFSYSSLCRSRFRIRKTINKSNVCWQDYTKIEQMTTKLGWRVDLSPEKTPQTFGVDQDKGVETEFLSYFLNIFGSGVHFSGSWWKEWGEFRWLVYMSSIWRRFQTKIQIKWILNVLFNIGLSLIKLKETVGPWWRYALYWMPF